MKPSAQEIEQRPLTKMGDWDWDMELPGLGVQIIINDYNIAFTW